MDITNLPTAEDLRASVKDFRDGVTNQRERTYIMAWWAQYGILNQFAAMTRAAEIERAAALPRVEN